MINNLDLIKETMTSVELAEFSGREHYNLMRDIKTMCEDAEINALKIEGVYIAGDGQEYKMYKLDKKMILTRGN